MHEAEFDQKGQEENIWEQVLEELGEPQSIGKNEMEIRAGVERHQVRMAKRFEQLKEELSS
jgi:hypothetical protein|tara:strand:+ start:109 stop:291 length:183 start_codon:yes stop_codon:yes gene_type:complete